VTPRPTATRARATLATIAGIALAACGNAPPPSHAIGAMPDAGTNDGAPSAADETDASAGGNDDAAPPLAPAPPVDTPPPPGFVKESADALSPLDGEKKIAIAFASDGCVRVAFAAGAPVSVTLGVARVESRAIGLVGERGPVCERAGKSLELTFRGRAHVNYEVWRTAPR
jgi:hypothetical protein